MNVFDELRRGYHVSGGDTSRVFAPDQSRTRRACMDNRTSAGQWCRCADRQTRITEGGRMCVYDELQRDCCVDMTKGARVAAPDRSALAVHAWTIAPVLAHDIEVLLARQASPEVAA